MKHEEFVPQCFEQWAPDLIEDYFDLGRDFKLKCLKQDRRAWIVKNGEFVPRLSEQGLVGRYTAIFEQRQATIPTAEPLVNADSSEAQPLVNADNNLQPSLAADDSQDVPLKNRRFPLEVTRRQLFDHVDLSVMERIPVSYIPSVRAFLHQALVGVLLRKTEEAEKRVGIHSQKNPGILSEDLLK